MQLLIGILFVSLPLAVFAMGQQPPARSTQAITDFVKSCSRATQKEFKKKFPKYNINNVTYTINAKDKKITVVTVRGSDPNACANLPPQVVSCNDFGNSITGKCLSGKLIEVID